jgi:hypothetical protein
MAKKAKGFGVNSHIASNKRKRPGRHSKNIKEERNQNVDKVLRFRLDKI